VLASRHRGEPAIACVGIARRRIDEHDVELVLGHPRRDLLDLVVVAEREFDEAKAGVRGLGEAVQERNFVEQETQIGREARHRSSLHSAEALRNGTRNIVASMAGGDGGHALSRTCRTD
jgi:hypothetical protein